MENYNFLELIFFDEVSGKIYILRFNDKVIVILMNQLGLGGFFVYYCEEEIKI